MDYAEIIAELKSEIAEAQAALRYFEKKQGERTLSASGTAESAVRHAPVEIPPARRELRAATVEHSGESIPTMVVRLLQADQGRAWSVSEIISGVQNANEKSLRGALNRLVADGRLVRASRGLYQINPNTAEVQQIVA